jgi:predicted membrane-bound spermidine synthase
MHGSTHQTQRKMPTANTVDSGSRLDAGLNLQPEVESADSRGLRDTTCPVTVRNAREGLMSAAIHIVFVISGISALIYQLVWQRALLMLYGSNTESVAVVVAAFMIGLGLGSIAGGSTSKRNGAPLVLLFSATELLIGLYGAISLRLFKWVGSYTLGAGTLETGLLAFSLVFVPTLLMGATLPMLVAYRVNSTGRVGDSISWLYFVNTLGGGIGAFLAGFVILRQFGLAGSTQAAAALNLFCATFVLLLWKLQGACK